MTARVAEILIPLALDQTYSYAVPDGLELAPGRHRGGPLGAFARVGVVWEVRRDRAAGNLKPIEGTLDVPAARPPRCAARRLDRLLHARAAAWPLRWRCGCPRRPAERVPGRRALERGAAARMTPARARVLAAPRAGSLMPKRELAEPAGVGAGVIDGLVDDGTL